MMNNLTCLSTCALLALLSVICLTAVIEAAQVNSNNGDVLAKLNVNTNDDGDKSGKVVRIAEHPTGVAYRYAGYKRDPFAEYGHFRFGKRAQQPSFAEYGHLRFGKRARSPPSYADYGHLRFGRSAVTDETDVYRADFDDINDVE